MKGLINFFFYLLLIVNILIIIKSTINMLKSDAFKKIRYLRFEHEQMTKLLTNNKMANIILTIMLIALGLIGIATGTSFIWIPIVVYLKYDFKTGLLTLIIILLIISTLWSLFLYSKKNRIKDTQKSIIREFILVIIFVQIYLLFTFKDISNIYANMELLYNEASELKNIISVLYPIFFFSIIFTNSYLVYIYIIKLRKNSKTWVLSYSNLLFIFVISSIIGILLISNKNLDFTLNEKDSFLKTFDSISMIISALIIPLLLNKLSNKKSNCNEIDNKKDLKYYIKYRGRRWNIKKEYMHFMII